MSLATVIRAEFAYPGVGVLAGDSLQYLSIATAHGVIMVFFMIMPALFGAFGNFLLPTQLGVHDVAFPRLNSAAFWFLPGGLVMLLQLVCVDRRYQRMNAFNIRELQASLKRSYFTDLLNIKDQREVLRGSMLGLRYKLNSSATSEYDTHVFHLCGPTVSPKLRGSASQTYQTGWNFLYTPLNFNAVSSGLVSSSTHSSLSLLGGLNAESVSSLTKFTFSMNQLNILFSPLDAVTAVTASPLYNLTYRLQSMTIPVIPSPSTLNYNSFTEPMYQRANVIAALNTKFDSERFGHTGLAELGLLSGSEGGANLKYSRFSDSLIDYDYRTGNYFGR